MKTALYWLYEITAQPPTLTSSFSHFVDTLTQDINGLKKDFQNETATIKILNKIQKIVDWLTDYDFDNNTPVVQTLIQFHNRILYLWMSWKPDTNDSELLSILIQLGVIKALTTTPNSQPSGTQ